MTELVTNSFTLGLLFASLGIFGWLAIKSQSIRTFQFQISIFIIIWIVGEIVNMFVNVYGTKYNTEEIGLKIHLVAMILFTVLLWARFYHSKRSEKRIENDSSGYYLE